MTDCTDFINSRGGFIQYCDNDTVKVMLSGEWNANITFVGNRAKGSIYQLVLPFMPHFFIHARSSTKARRNNIITDI